MVRRKAESHVGRVPIAIRDKILDIILIARDKIRCPPRPPWRSGSLLFSAHAVGCVRPGCNPTYFLPKDCTQAPQVQMLKTRKASRRPSSACHTVNLHNANSDTHTHNPRHYMQDKAYTWTRGRSFCRPLSALTLMLVRDYGPNAKPHVSGPCRLCPGQRLAQP